MTWKHTLGKPGNTYVITKHWVKKNIPKSKRLPKLFSKEVCPDYIYNIGLHYLPDNPKIPQEIWICLKTGVLFTKTDILMWLKESRSKLENSIVNKTME
ncbi:MAG: hypothetical protein ACFFB2_15530 [Promethearchaeota archaeon]